MQTYIVSFASFLALGIVMRLKSSQTEPCFQ